MVRNDDWTRWILFFTCFFLLIFFVCSTVTVTIIRLRMQIPRFSNHISLSSLLLMPNLDSIVNFNFIFNFFESLHLNLFDLIDESYKLRFPPCATNRIEFNLNNFHLLFSFFYTLNFLIIFEFMLLLVTFFLEQANKSARTLNNFVI